MNKIKSNNNTPAVTIWRYNIELTSCGMGPTINGHILIDGMDSGFELSPALWLWQANHKAVNLGSDRNVSGEIVCVTASMLAGARARFSHGLPGRGEVKRERNFWPRSVRRNNASYPGTCSGARGGGFPGHRYRESQSQGLWCDVRRWWPPRRRIFVGLRSQLALAIRTRRSR